jgi:uncharacterized protein YjbJ (UPF0337 family)
MKRQSTKDKIQGKGRAIKGRAKQAVGRALKNPELEDQGRAEKWAGKAQHKVGEIEKVFET